MHSKRSREVRRSSGAGRGGGAKLLVLDLRPDGETDPLATLDELLSNSLLTGEADNANDSDGLELSGA